MGTKLCGCNNENLQEKKEENVFIYNNHKFLLLSS